MSDESLLQPSPYKDVPNHTAGDAGPELLPIALTMGQVAPTVYAAEHIIINGRRSLEPWKDRYFVPLEEHNMTLAQQAQELERVNRDVTTLNELLRRQGLGQGEIDGLASEFEDLKQQLAAMAQERDEAERRAERLFRDRFTLLNVKTIDGLSASEWIMRTATAEGKAKELTEQLAAAQARIRELEGKHDAL